MNNPNAAVAASTRTIGRWASVVMLLIAALVLGGCSASDPAPSTSTAQADTADAILADYGLAGLDAKQLIEKLDTLPVTERPTDLIASIRPNELVLKAGQDREASLPMPTDEFYVSFAPYITQTHDCHFHSLTTCKGELQNAEVQVKVVSADGETLVDETTSTYDNGFLGVWLPRDIDATLSVEHDGRSVSLPITTKGADSATCLTTLQLQ